MLTQMHTETDTLTICLQKHTRNRTVSEEHTHILANTDMISYTAAQTQTFEDDHIFTL